MDIKKFITGTVVGGIAFFFLGFLIYGILLMDFFMAHSGSATGVARTTDMVWWALVLGNLSAAALLTYIFLQWANVSSFSKGLSTAATIGFFMTLSYDMTNYGTSNIMDLTAAFTDVIAGTTMTAIGGGIIGAVLGMGKKA